MKCPEQKTRWSLVTRTLNDSLMLATGRSSLPCFRHKGIPPQLVAPRGVDDIVPGPGKFANGGETKTAGHSYARPPTTEGLSLQAMAGTRPQVWASTSLFRKWNIISWAGEVSTPWAWRTGYWS